MNETSNHFTPSLIDTTIHTMSISITKYPTDTSNTCTKSSVSLMHHSCHVYVQSVTLTPTPSPWYSFSSFPTTRITTQTTITRAHHSAASKLQSTNIYYAKPVHYVFFSLPRQKCCQCLPPVSSCRSSVPAWPSPCAPPPASSPLASWSASGRAACTRPPP